MTQDSNKNVTCPTCGKTVTWSEQSPWRPFCSERCRLIDLGEWISEKHRIPGEEDPLAGEDSNHHDQDPN